MRRRQRPSTFVPAIPVHCVEHALFVATVLARRRPSCTAVLLLDDCDLLIDVIPVEAAESVEEIADVVLQAARRSPTISAVALLSLRPGAGIDLAEDELAAWRRMRRRYDDIGVTLLDWLVVDRGLARSMAETAGSSPQWVDAAMTGRSPPLVPPTR